MTEAKVPELGGISVEFTCGGQTTQEKGKLLGAGAMVVETARHPALKSIADLRFRPGSGSPLVEVRGVVEAHVEGGGLRVQFTDLSEEHRRHLLELLYPTGAERRTTARVSLVTQIRSTVGGETLVGYTRDISAGGVFVETEQPAEKGTEVKLRFRLSPDTPILEAQARVVYSMAGEGMGLAFVNLPAAVRKAIEELVAG